MIRAAYAIIMAVFVVAGCFDDHLTPCTDMFAFIEISVVDDMGDAVSDVAIQVVLARTGEVLDVRHNSPTPGTYTVVDDSHREYIGLYPERFVVTGTRDTRGFSAEFLINVDSGRCHIHKVAGPDSVLLE